MAIRKALKREYRPTQTDVPQPEGMCTIAKVAEFLAISRRMVERLTKDGRLASVKIGRVRRVSWESVLRFAGKVPRQKTPRVEHTSDGTIIHVDAEALRAVITDVVREVLRQQSSKR